MALLDTLLNQATKTLKAKAAQGLNAAANKAESTITSAVTNKKETFTFEAIPQTLEELKSLKEAELKTPYQAAALAVVALCTFKQNPDITFEMLEFLNGPDEVSTYTKQFIKQRLGDKMYLPFSFFAGATPKNDYTPTTPYQITVFSNSYSFNEENWATIYVTSGGADNPRGIKLRKKPSTGQWFVNDIQIFTDIRVPESQNPWA